MTIRDLFAAVKKRFLLVLIIPIVIASCTAIYNIKFVTKIYSTSTTFVVARNKDASTEIYTQQQQSTTQSDINLWSELVGNYRELLKSETNRTKTAKALGITGISKDSISVSTTSADSQVIKVTVEHSDPEIAAKIANELVSQFRELVKEVYGMEYVNVIDIAQVKDTPVYPTTERNVIIALIAGIIASVGLVILLEFWDMTLKTNEDAEKHLGLPVLARIPRYFQ